MIGQRNASVAFSLRKRLWYQLNGKVLGLLSQDSNPGSLPSSCIDYVIPLETIAAEMTATTKTITTTTTAFNAH
jgi:hypothetical protein